MIQAFIMCTDVSQLSAIGRREACMLSDIFNASKTVRGAAACLGSFAVVYPHSVGALRL